MRKIFSSHLTSMPRPYKQVLMLVTDIVLMTFAGWAAYSIRLGDFFVPNSRQVLLLAAAPLLALPFFVVFGLYRSIIRYVGEYALWAAARAMTLAALCWTGLAFLTSMTGYEGMPRSVPLMYWMIGFILLGGSRFLARWVLWKPVKERFRGRQVMIYGAGAAGRQLAASLRQGKELLPAGFLDDDPRLHGTDVAGVRVYSPKRLRSLIDQFGIHDVIVTLPSVSAARRREVVALLERHRVHVRILPALVDIASGRHLVNMVREVNIGDLLGRDPVAADPSLLGRSITDKRVLVSGAGGSIGSELCRQIALQNPSRMVLVESSEHALYQIERHIRGLVDIPVQACLGSVTDEALMRRLIEDNRIQTVYHAAAHKHVPLVEANVIEGTRNNVLGTRALAQSALAAGVETFVLISTDKAVRPTNVMGATKRWAELVVQDAARTAAERGTGQRFCAVRFGNVLGSSGSVIPLFKEQIQNGGPVTVTHEDVTRYFMSIHEAVELVIQAGSMAQGGEVFLLNMGEPVKIIDLARNMIRLAGHTVCDADCPDGDIEIEVTGLRPGEKLYEELLIASSNAEGTSHPKIMKANEPCVVGERLVNLMNRLEYGLDRRDSGATRDLLMSIALATGAELDSVSAPPVLHRIDGRKAGGTNP
ncbi:nucleoside-diphosphate sugar epimerase/dehydratase [Pandoraea sp. SD6-2]|uniref:polysaccharide biosynthesis protein n=1 Tax=Pandoraea sp. SD6-2 TaxID=1286093 RepID=UPI000330B1D2|nr:nucleoside-diphosphate sugar epimerase/dehydratase [Pandoraea sp. SD6-2]EON11764.1 polysaccharide biosynthesis protein CapD [Pandoraea sp. SD6-2]